MNMQVLLALLVVLSAFVIVGLIMRRAGPGLIRRSLDCPVSRQPAKVRFIRGEGSFGSVKLNDVASCSLFPNAPVACGKECMR